MDASGCVKEVFRRGPPKVPSHNTLYGVKSEDFIDFLKVVYNFSTS